MQLKFAICIGGMVLFFNGCTMGHYSRTASECTTKSIVYKNEPKRDCFCSEKEQTCPCSENKNSYTLHAYKGRD